MVVDHFVYLGSIVRGIGFGSFGIFVCNDNKLLDLSQLVYLCTVATNYLVRIIYICV